MNSLHIQRVFILFFLLNECMLQVPSGTLNDDLGTLILFRRASRVSKAKLLSQTPTCFFYARKYTNLT